VAATRGTRVTAGVQGVELRTPDGRYSGLTPLPGAHQAHNLLVAVRLLEAAREAGVAVDVGELPGALASVRWPGRLEWVPGDPGLLLDGAHNPAGAGALAEYLRGIGPFVLVFGAMTDKAVEPMARTLFPLARAVVLTRPPMARAVVPEELVRRVGPLARVARAAPGVRSALLAARRLAAPAAAVVVAGSLYLVGAVKKELERRPW
jgi:dihydrofolate synthase / folylpolyglutamate synthase